MKLELEPYLSTLGKSWPCTDFEVPGKKVYVAADVTSTKFERYAKIDGYFKFKYTAPIDGGREQRTYDAHLWWEDGMQRYVCHTVTILTDDPDEGVYCGFCFQNHADYFMLLGKLKDGDEFTETCRRALAAFKF